MAKYLTLSRIEFNIEGLQEWTKERFDATYTHHSEHFEEINAAMLTLDLKPMIDESIKRPSKKDKSIGAAETNEIPAKE